MRRIFLNVGVMRRWLLPAACAVLWTTPSVTSAASGEASRELRPLVRPGKVVHRQVIIKLPAQEYGNSCKARVELRYAQSGEQADVRAQISNEDCAASTGNYELRLRITDASGERHTLKFSEDWSRDDALLIETDRSYEIGDDVDLVSARLTSASCQCVNESTVQEQPP